MDLLKQQALFSYFVDFYQPTKTLQLPLPAVCSRIRKPWCLRPLLQLQELEELGGDDKASILAKVLVLEENKINRKMCSALWHFTVTCSPLTYLSASLQCCS